MIRGHSILDVVEIPQIHRAKGWISVVAEHAVTDAVKDEGRRATSSTRWLNRLGRATLLGPLHHLSQGGLDGAHPPVIIAW
jgi:hypothetical protein